MNSRRFSPSLASALFAIPLVLSVPAAAQEVSLGEMVGKSIAAMKTQQWQEALKWNTEAVDVYGRNKPLQLFGPQFGNIWYRKGLCEMKLKQWDAAMASFETCYKGFPNKGEVAGGGNIFHERALLRWGEAAMGEKNWELAIKQFQKFLKEHDKTRDKYSQGSFYVSLAICHFELGKIPEGNEFLEIAIRNKTRFPTSDSSILSGFQSLVSGVILKRNEQALIDFIGKNRGELVIEPFEMHRYSKVFMKLAGNAVGADMPRAALALYQFVPSTSAALDDTKARLKAISPLARAKDGATVLDKAVLEADLASLEADLRGKKTPEMVKLAATAFIHEKHGNVRGAFNAYRLLEKYHPNSEKREDNLFNLVRTSSLTGDTSETQQYAEAFLKTYPDSEHVPIIRRMMLSAIFYSGDYDTCIEIAAPMLERLEPGSVEHDMCLHVLGGSYFYTAEFDKARPLLEQHVADYPKSLFVIPATYFEAANLSRLQFWGKAASQLDKFLEKYPDASKNVFLPFALYDRATCHFSEEENEAALEKIARVIKEFPETNIIDQAYTLRGNVEQASDQPARAEKAYVKGLEIAELRGNRVVAGEALYSLVALLGEKPAGKKENPRMKDALPYADLYWEKYADGSPYQSKMAVAQFPAMQAAGRGDEGLKRLQVVISEIAKSPQAIGLEELINSYTEAYLEDHTPEELKDHYYAFPDIRSNDHAARALLRVAIIGVFEDVAKKTDDPARKRSALAMIKVLFQQLKSDFKLADLTNFILVKVGDYLRLNTSTPREALPYYDEALGRQNQAYRFAALLGRADVNGRSANEANLDKAIEDFTRVVEDSKEKSEREFSSFRIIELLMAKGEFAAAADKANAYLDRKKSGFSKFAPEVGLMLAKSFEDRKMTEDAIAMYVKVWSAHMGNIKISAPAMVNWMQLSWDRNKPGDRQGAYEGGARYLGLTGRFKNKMTDDDLALWTPVEKLVQTYQANPSIKSLEQLKAEKEAARRR